MPTSDPLEILLAHDAWATRKLLDAAAKLTPEQFHQRFEMGPGSVHDTLTHILGAMRAWSDMLAARPMRPRPEGARRTVAELDAMLDQSAADFAACVRALPLSETITRIRDGKSYTFTRGAVLVHVATHGTHHRAQCLNMLRHLGVQPLPPSSVAEWTHLADGV